MIMSPAKDGITDLLSDLGVPENRQALRHSGNGDVYLRFEYQNRTYTVQSDTAELEDAYVVIEKRLNRLYNALKTEERYRTA